MTTATDLVPTEIDCHFDFGDKRLNKRASNVIKALTGGLGLTSPQVFKSEAELAGFYRLIDNELVCPRAILDPHVEATIARCKAHESVSVLNDSSDCSFNFLSEIKGFGPLHPKVGKGLRLHPLLAVTESGTPLGILEMFNYSRNADAVAKAHRNSLPIEQKESYRWLQSYEFCCELREEMPTTEVVYIADREADIYEILAAAILPSDKPKAGFIIRSCANRILVSSDKSERKLREKLSNQPVVMTSRVDLNLYRKDARTADLEIRACLVELKAPKTPLKRCQPSVQVNAVMVSEANPPEGVMGLSWILLTSLPIDTPENIQKIVTKYSHRWRIEIYFKVLKSGCQIDARRFQERYRIENYIAFAMLVAWRAMLLTYLPREYPEAPCTVILSEIEWKLAFLSAHEGRKPLPSTAPTLKEAVILVAMLAGYQKKRQMPPGIQTVWFGLMRLVEQVRCYEITRNLDGNLNKIKDV